MSPALQFMDGFEKFLDGNIAVRVQHQPEFIRVAAQHINGEFGELLGVLNRIHDYLFQQGAKPLLDPGCGLCYRVIPNIMMPHQGGLLLTEKQLPRPAAGTETLHM